MYIWAIFIYYILIFNSKNTESVPATSTLKPLVAVSGVVQITDEQKLPGTKNI